jgi:membrane-bound serine protease (ClpP class)
LVLRAVLDNQTINPSVAGFIERAIRQAEQERAVCLVLELDTPGGLADSTRDIVKTMLGSEVPVVVYVAPAGARAASAGVFITLAANVAAMAPGTHIGAAHPVELGGLPGPLPTGGGAGKTAKGESGSPMEEKVLNDTVAWARAVAELRGRNADWAEKAVKESVSVPASEAVREHVVDFVADNFRDLLAKLNGRVVSVPGGTVRLATSGAEVRAVEMSWSEQLLSVIGNPNVALLLLVFGFYGILFEFFAPGWKVAGVFGVICLVLGLFAMSVLPINIAGLGLVALAFALFAAELFVTSYGLLTIGGMICLVFGGLILVQSPAGFQRVSLGVLLPVAAGAAAVTAFLLARVVRIHRRPPQTGIEAMTRWPAVAAEEFAANGHAAAGAVRVRGELWNAVATMPIAAGQHVEIVGRHGLVLSVRPIPNPMTTADGEAAKQPHD